MTCVVDHDTGRLVWAAEGRNSETILKFFHALGAERAKELTHVSADGAEWIHTPVKARAPQAVLCMDPFHVVQWATNAVDKVRRTMWNTLRGEGKCPFTGRVDLRVSRRVWRGWGRWRGMILG